MLLSRNDACKFSPIAWPRHTEHGKCPLLPRAEIMFIAVGEVPSCHGMMLCSLTQVTQAGQHPCHMARSQHVAACSSNTLSGTSLHENHACNLAWAALFLAPWYQDRLQRTALHWAAEMGQHETAQTLIDFGIDVKAVECTGR